MRYFISGIGTDVGKTLVSAVLVKALNADYWKPVQAGSLDWTDTMQVKAWTADGSTQYFPEQFQLNLPMSPHAAAAQEGIKIQLADFKIPNSNKHLIVEGAGGLLVPLNDHDLVIDLIPLLADEVILVSRNYLGSINHTLLSIEALKQRKLKLKGIVFNGNENAATEEIILKHSQSKMLFRIPELSNISKEVIEEIANELQFI